MNVERRSDHPTTTRIALGLTVQTPWPEALVAATLMGRDWVLIDRERGSIGPEHMEQLLRAAEATGIPAIVRLASCADDEIARALDGGAYGLLAPSLSDASRLVALVEALRAHPRSLRARTVGEQPAAFGTEQGTARQLPLVCVQIEDAVGLLDLPELLAVNSLDLVFVAPQALARSMGYQGQPEASRVRGVIDDAFAAIRAANKIPGVFGDAAVARHYLAWGGYFYTDLMASRTPPPQ